VRQVSGFKYKRSTTRYVKRISLFLLFVVLMMSMSVDLVVGQEEEPHPEEPGPLPEIFIVDGGVTSMSVDLLAGQEEEPPPEEPGPPPDNVPVDGGLSLLLAAGAAYGVRRLRGRKEKK
jgi:hypothetical protein